MPQVDRWRHGRWALAITLAIVTIASMATGAVYLLRTRAGADLSGWAELEKTATGRRGAEVKLRLERWILAHPEHGEARTLLANIELGLQHRDAAVALLQSVPELDPSWARAQMMLGTLAVRDRHAAEAERIFRRVAERDPRALEPRRNLLYLLGLQLRTAEARAILWQIYRIGDDPRVLVDLVLDLLSDQQDVRGLAPELELLVAQTPDDAFLRRAWGMALLYQGHPRDALPHLEDAARSLVNDPFGRFALAECRIVLGKPVNADEVLGPVPDQPVDQSQWWLFRGRIEETTGLTDRAITSVERAVALNPENREAHFRLGQALKRLGRAEPAQLHLERASRIEERLKVVRREHQRVRRAGLPSDPRLFERLGQLCADSGLFAESRAWFEQALKLDPGSQESRSRLASRQFPETMPFALPDPRLGSAPVARIDRASPKAVPAAPRQPPPFEEARHQRGDHLLLREWRERSAALHRRHHGWRGRTDRLTTTTAGSTSISSTAALCHST